jgi:hypothetical protein
MPGRVLKRGVNGGRQISEPIRVQFAAGQETSLGVERGLKPEDDPVPVPAHPPFFPGKLDEGPPDISESGENEIDAAHLLFLR